MSGSLVLRPMRRAICLVVCAAAPMMMAATSHAAIMGFGNFSGFSINQSDTGAPPTVSVAAGSITLTTVGQNQARSVFSTTPQPVGLFTASFTYRATNVEYQFGRYQGAAFVIQNASAGPTAVGGNLSVGYSGVSPSLALVIAMTQPGNNGITRATLGKNGVLPTPTDIAPVNAYDGNPIEVTVSYDGTFVRHALRDTVTNANWSTDYFLNPSLRSLIGSDTAYVGITAGTAGGASQTISNFRFTPTVIPEPTVLAVLPALFGLLHRRR